MKLNQKTKDEDGNEFVSGMIDDLEDGFGREYKNQIEKNVLRSMVANKKGTNDWLEHEKIDRQKVKGMFDAEKVKLRHQMARF